MKYWGKSYSDGRWHSLGNHCLDVAATFEAFLAANPLLVNTIETLSPCAGTDIQRLLVFFASVHDIGKFSFSFQNLVPELARELGHDSSTRYEHHTVLGLNVWPTLPAVQESALLNSYALRPLVVSALSHHGVPQAAGRLPRLKRYFGQGVDDANYFVDECRRHFLHELEPVSAKDDAFRKISWIVSGLFILADWVGSNEIWFPPVPEWLGVDEYWPIAQQKALRAVQESRLVPPAPSRSFSFAKLMPHLGDEAKPRPMQERVLALPEPSGPELLIIEDLTGGGKTEAAILAAHRLMKSNQATGVFFGLPTMATANAMYGRLAECYRALFEEKDASLVLAHGSQVLNDDFIESLDQLVSSSRAEGHEGEGSAVCASWFADNRKKALLAPCGAGTIDQALLAILSAKHQGLRLLGLIRSVLVVDEVHAYDIYTSRLLKNLLVFHAAHGGSAVLLSATLPRALRRDLMEAWQLGREMAGLEMERKDCASSSFPLMTRVTAEGIQEIHAEAGRELVAEIDCVHTEQGALKRLVAAHDAGACACWVRNTVGDAVEARRQLIEECGLASERIMLFHARYTGADRMTIEQRVLDEFGKESSPEKRAGRILIATQVVEQSLDLDFDLIVSDLAPMELMIQRLGRCHRHVRPRPEGYESRRMVVLMPDVDDAPDEKWYGRLFPGGQWVYKRPAVLWRTARLLHAKKRIQLPGDARELVEGAYGEIGEDVPAVFCDKEDKADGDDYSADASAQYVMLDFERGYEPQLDGGGWTEDVLAPTRMGQMSRQVRLIKVEGGRAELWADETGYVSLPACLRSEVRVNADSLVESEAPDEVMQAVEALKDRMPDKGKWALCLPLWQDEAGEWVGEGLDSTGNRISIVYSEGGLQIMKK